jgi:hypothetical protein
MMADARHDMVPIKEHLDQRLADLTKLGAVTAAAVVAGGWITFALIGKALTVALAANNRDVENHNGKIRQWEIERGEREAKLATKAEVEPLVVDYRERRGGAITAGKFWGVIVVVGGFMLTAGIALANLLPGLGG